MVLPEALLLLGTASVVSAVVRTDKCRAIMLCMVENKRLTGHSVTVTDNAATASRLVCAERCLSSASCLSINYSAKGVCELSTAHKSDHPADFVDDPGYTYYGEDVCGTLTAGNLCGQTSVTTTTAAPTTTTEVVCTLPKEKIGNRCLHYKDLGFMSLTWQQAGANCATDYDRSPVITDSSFYSALIAASAAKGMQKIWTSYYYDDTTSSWKWPGGGAFTKWAPGHNTASSHKCAVLNTNSAGNVDGFEKVDCSTTMLSKTWCEQP